MHRLGFLAEDEGQRIRPEVGGGFQEAANTRRPTALGGGLKNWRATVGQLHAISTPTLIQVLILLP
jgi:hypothetical protein